MATRSGPKSADAELPQAFRIEIVEIDVVDGLDPRRLERRRAADDREIDAANSRNARRVAPRPPLPMTMRTP
jgi:hypothetical protein